MSRKKILQIALIPIIIIPIIMIIGMSIPNVTLDEPITNDSSSFDEDYPHATIQITTVHNLYGHSNFYLVTFEVSTPVNIIENLRINVTSDIDQKHIDITSLREGDDNSLVSFIQARNPDSITAEIVHYTLT